MDEFEAQRQIMQSYLSGYRDGVEAELAKQKKAQEQRDIELYEQFVTMVENQYGLKVYGDRIEEETI